MAKLEKILNKGKKGAKNLIIGGAMALGSLGIFNDSNAQSRFYQPLDTYDFYGSGDVNNDFKINEDDAIAMQAVINGTYVFEEGDYIGAKRADMNFDGDVTSVDLDSLVSHLNWEKLLTPRGHYNQLKTPQERLERAQQIANLANLEETCIGAPPEEDCDCDHFTYNGLFIIEGPKDTAIVNNILRAFPHDYDFTRFGEFKIPVDVVSITEYDVPSYHAMLRFNIGNDLEEWVSGSNFEPQLGLLDVQPGEGYFKGDDSSFRVDGPPKGVGDVTLSQFTEFEVKNKIPTLIWTGWAILGGTVESKRDTTHPLIETNLEQGKVYDGSPRIQISFIEDNFNQGYITPDNGVTRIPLSKENDLNLNLSKGEHNLAIYVQDEAGLETLERYSFETLSPNGLEDKLEIPKLHIYPNPPRDFVRAKYAEGKNAYLEVFNMLGQKVKRIEDYDGNGETEFDSSDLAEGIYGVRVIAENNEVLGTGKLVKQ